MTCTTILPAITDKQNTVFRVSEKEEVNERKRKREEEQCDKEEK